MSPKHLLLALLLLFVFCGTVSGAATTLTISVYDVSSGNDPIRDVKVVLTKDGIDQTLYTNTNGVASFAAVEYQGTYRMKVTKDGYETQEQSLYINTMNKDYSIYLQKANLVQVRVQDSETSKTISGAEVVVDGYNAGTTNSAGVVHVSMEKGAYHNLKVTSPTYEQYSSAQYIDVDQTSLVVSLTKSYYTPLVLVYGPDKVPVGGASVSVDGKFAGYTDSYGRAPLSKQTAGTYKLEVTKDNYISYEKAVNFDEDTSDIIVDLEYATVPVTVLVADGTTPVSAAYISLDGVVTGFSDVNGKFTTKLTPGATVLIEASKDGYSGTGLTYQVKATEENIVSIPLSPTLRLEYVLAAGFVVVAVLLVLILIRTSGKGKRGKKNDGGGNGKRDSI